MTDIVRDPNSLTKDKLKKELMKRNVTLPTSEKRKDVYVQLYREHVLSNLASFSSDEEDTFGGAKVSQRKSKPGSPRKSVSQKASGTSASIDPMKLTDEELAAELRNRGVDVGPILDTTRKVYQKKLDKLLKEAPVKSEPVIQVEEEEEEEEEEDYSDEEEVQTQVKQVIQTKVESVRKRQVRDSPKPPSRTGTPRKTTRIEPEKPATNEVNDVIQEKPKKLTPPPQRISTTTRNTIPTKSTDTSAAAKPPQKRAFSIKVQLAILVIVAIVIFFVITKMEPAFSNHIRPLVGKMGGK